MTTTFNIRNSEWYTAEFVGMCTNRFHQDPDGSIIPVGEDIYYVYPLEKPYVVGNMASSRWCKSQGLL